MANDDLALKRTINAQKAKIEELLNNKQTKAKLISALRFQLRALNMKQFHPFKLKNVKFYYFFSTSIKLKKPSIT